MPEEIDQILAPFSLKGMVGDRIPQGTRVNEFGETEHLYTVTSDPEFGDQPNAQQKYEFEYILWHQTYHKGVRDSRCTICTAEAQFQAQREPHERNHRQRRFYDPQCRFCQDDRFFGRM